MTKSKWIVAAAAALFLAWGLSCQSPSSSGDLAGGGFAGSRPATTPSTPPTGSTGGSTPATGLGTLELTITDGPVDNVSRILVKMTEIRVHQACETDDGCFVTVWSNPAGQEIDVLKLKTDPIVFTTALAAGKYNQIRISLSKDPGKIYFKDAPAVDYPLDVPSDELKIHFQFDVVGAGLTQVLLDFDAEQSLHVVQKGKKSEYLLRPVINPVSQRTTAGA